MKKRICWLLAAMLSLGILAGCAGNTVTPPESETPSASQPEEESEKPESKEPESKEPEETSEEPEEEDLPPAVQQVYEKIVAVAEKEYPDMQIQGFTRDSFDNPVLVVEDQSDESLKERERTLEIKFGASSFQEEDSSNYVFFDVETQTSVIKNWIMLWMQACDDSLSKEQAQEKMQAFVNTYTPDAFSEVVACGDYWLMLSPGDGDSGVQTFQAVHKEYMWETIDEAAYAPAEYDTYQASTMNKGTKVVVKGTVTGYTIDDPDETLPCVWLTVQDENGNTYLADYAYEQAPVLYPVGTQVTVYASIWTHDGEPALSVKKIDS